MNWMFKLKKERTMVKHIRQCQCGASGVGPSTFYDLVNCQNCGLLYYIGPGVVNPIARIEYIKET